MESRMKRIEVCDATLLLEQSALSFREKLEIARLLDRIGVDAIELAQIRNEKADSLLVKTIAQTVKNAAVAIPAGLSSESCEQAARLIQIAQRPRLQVRVPVSAVQMEYMCHCKPDKMLSLIDELVTQAKRSCDDVEFVAEDATRAEKEFLCQAIEKAVKCGAGRITICDSTGELFPEEMAEFIAQMPDIGQAKLGLQCSDGLHLAAACTASGLSKAITVVKTTLSEGPAVDLEDFAAIFRARAVDKKLECGLAIAEIGRISAQIKAMLHSQKKETSAFDNTNQRVVDEEQRFGQNATITDISQACRELGYDLSSDDLGKVFEAFVRFAQKKEVGLKELDAIVASSSLQVPPVYKLDSYVINSGSLITATALLKLEKGGQILSGFGIGDGPIDASFLAFEQILGHHYELDDFQIQAVTQGREAMGQALVRLRADGKLYSGRGISTDIIGASIRAYLNSLNKILYEEGQR